MKRQEPSGLERAYRLWTAAGVTLIVAAVAGSSAYRLLSGAADASSAVWGIVGITALLASLVLFVLGWRLRHRHANTVQSYESREPTWKTTDRTGRTFPCWATDKRDPTLPIQGQVLRCTKAA